jgi:hypothetical protein
MGLHQLNLVFLLRDLNHRPNVCAKLIAGKLRIPLQPGVKPGQHLSGLRKRYLGFLHNVIREGLRDELILLFMQLVPLEYSQHQFVARAFNALILVAGHDTVHLNIVCEFENRVDAVHDRACQCFPCRQQSVQQFTHQTLNLFLLDRGDVPIQPSQC